MENTMNTLQLINLKEGLESEELEFWELNDFDDVIHSFEVTEVENQSTWNNNFIEDVDYYH